MAHNTNKKGTMFGMAEFGFSKGNSTLRHQNLYASTHPGSTMHFNSRYKRAMSLEEKIEELESKSKIIEEKAYQMQVRAQNIEKRARVLEKRNQMLEKRTLKLKENRKIGSRPKVRINIGTININYGRSPGLDSDISVSSYNLQVKKQARSESDGVLHHISKDSLNNENHISKLVNNMTNQVPKEAMMVKNQCSGLRSIVKGISNLSIPPNKEEQ